MSLMVLTDEFRGVWTGFCVLYEVVNPLGSYPEGYWKLSGVPGRPKVFGDDVLGGYPVTP